MITPNFIKSFKGFGVSIENMYKINTEIHQCLFIPAVGSRIISLGNRKIIAAMHKFKFRKLNK